MTKNSTHIKSATAAATEHKAKLIPDSAKMHVPGDLTKSYATQLHLFADQLAEQEDRLAYAEAMLIQAHRLLALVGSQASPDSGIAGLISAASSELAEILRGLSEASRANVDASGGSDSAPSLFPPTLRKLADYFLEQTELRIDSWTPATSQTLVADRAPGPHNFARGSLNRVDSLLSVRNEKLSFYSNLFETSLTEYEQFQGWEQRRQSTGMTNAELATESGYPEHEINRVDSFKDLPPALHPLLAKAPWRLDAESAQELKKLIAAGRLRRVNVAIRAMAEDETVDQAFALRIASNPEELSDSGDWHSEFIWKNGRIFSEISHIEGQIALVLRDEDDAHLELFFHKLCEKILKEFSSGPSDSPKQS